MNWENFVSTHLCQRSGSHISWWCLLCGWIYLRQSVQVDGCCYSAHHQYHLNASSTFRWKMGTDCSSPWAELREVWLELKHDLWLFPLTWQLVCSRGLTLQFELWEAVLIINEAVRGQDMWKGTWFAWKSPRKTSLLSTSQLIRCWHPRHSGAYAWAWVWAPATNPSVDPADWMLRKSGHCRTCMGW